MSDNLPKVSFPYPSQGKTARPPGQGCLACVHKTYCPAMYWYRWYGERVDDYTGRQCGSFSSNPLDIVKEVTEDDEVENEYLDATGTLYPNNDGPDRLDAQE